MLLVLGCPHSRTPSLSTAGLGSCSQNRKSRKPGSVAFALADTTEHKAVFVKNDDAILEAGVGLYPNKMTVVMGKKKIPLRSKVKSFVKVCNYHHLMPTRYPVHLSRTKKSPTNLSSETAPKCKAQGKPGSSLETGTR